GQVNIRGSSGYVQGLGSRVLLLVDGVPANQGDRGGINWDLVPLEDVARVEVVKGAGSVLYGSAALGGVVNVITREIPTGFHARGRVVGGWFADPPHGIWKFRDYRGAQEGLDVTASYGSDVARGSFTAGGWHSDGYREQDRRNHWQTAGKAQWVPSPETHVTASGSWASDQYETPLIWCVQGTCDDRGQAFQPFMIDASGRGAFTRSDKGLLAATVEHRASGNFAWQARGSWGRTHFTDFQSTRDDWGVANRYGVEFRGDVHPRGDRVLTLGTEGTFSDVRTNIFTGDSNPMSNVVRTHDQHEFAAYAEGERQHGRVWLAAGARIDHIDVDGGRLATVLSPRLGVVLPTSRLGVWRASAGRGGPHLDGVIYVPACPGARARHRPRALACLPAEAPAHPRCRLPAWRDRRRGRLPLHEPPGPGGDLRDRSTRGGEDPRFAGECRLGGMDAARPARQRTQLHLQPSPPHTRSRPDAHSHDDLDALDWWDDGTLRGRHAPAARRPGVPPQPYLGADPDLPRVPRPLHPRSA